MNLETNSRPSRDASQDGLAVDDGPIFPMFSRKADQGDWLCAQEVHRRLAAQHDALRPNAQDLMGKALPMVEFFRTTVVSSDDHMAAAVSYSRDGRAALRHLHTVIRNMCSRDQRVHIFRFSQLQPGPRGPMADDCRGFVAMKWRLVP